MRAALLSLIVLILGIVPVAARGDLGHPRYRLDATSSFDPYAGETAWIKAHVNLIHGYGSFAREHYVAKGFPTIDYHDPSTEGYAPLTPANRARYMQKVEADKAQGFLGVANDDINFSLGFRDGNQNKASYEPEAKELGLLIEQERKFWPTAIIETNTQWHDLSGRLSDPNVQRMIANSSLIYKEFGVGPTSGITTRADWEALRLFDWHLQWEGKGIVYGGDYGSNTVQANEYTLATELYSTHGHDQYSTAGKYELPPTWWTGSDVDLGLPEGYFFCEAGYCVRLFSAGIVYLVQPGGPTHTFPVFGCSVEWGCPIAVTLHERQGAVFVE